MYNFRNDELLLIEYKKRDAKPFAMVQHSHSSYEIYLLMEGERQYFIKDQTYYIKKGALVLIPPFVLHKTMTSGRLEHERFLINVHKGFLKDLIDAMEEMDWFQAFDTHVPVLQLSLNERYWLQEKLLELSRIGYKTTVEHRNLTKILLLEILSFINRISMERAESGNEEAKEFISNESINQLIHQIVAYINDHYEKPLNLDNLGITFAISTYYLSRTFKQITGFGINEYINRVRILESMKMLLNTQESISSIAFLVGYESSTHYGRVFKKITGLSPRQYRKKKETEVH